MTTLPPGVCMHPVAALSGGAGTVSLPPRVPRVPVGLVAAGVEPRTRSVTPAIQAGVGAIALSIQAAVDPVAPAVEAGVRAIAPSIEACIGTVTLSVEVRVYPIALAIESLGERVLSRIAGALRLGVET